MRQHLIQNGVDVAKISVRGMGESNPIASNDTEAERERNRRVEVIVNGPMTTASGDKFTCKYRRTRDPGARSKW